jgi:hypothetical protein
MITKITNVIRALTGKGNLLKALGKLAKATTRYIPSLLSKGNFSRSGVAFLFGFPSIQKRQQDAEGKDSAVLVDDVWAQDFIDEVETGASIQADIKYSFSDAIRNHLFPRIDGSIGQYGQAGMSFSALYDLLCERFLGGERFIDTYFELVFPTQSVYQDYTELIKTLNEKVTRDARALRGKPRTGKAWQQMPVWEDENVKRSLRELGDRIRANIEQCMSTGSLPISKRTIALKTAKTRESLGLHHQLNQVFYASGQLVKNLRIYITLEGA